MSHKVSTFSHYTGSGGVSRPGALQANVCPHGVEHSASGECSGFISSLPSSYKLAPGMRSIYNAGPYVLKPFQYQYDGRVPCSRGFAPEDAGFVASCRPQGHASSGHNDAQRYLPSARYPYSSQYSYTY